MAITKVLSGHTSQDTAYLVPDYPYGFRLRCQIRYWIETKGKQGQRVVSQTSNPKLPGLVWNTPKASTYSLLRVLFLDEQGHVQNAGLSTYASVAEIDAFAATYADALTDDRSQKVLTFWRTMAERAEARRRVREAAQAENRG